MGLRSSTGCFGGGFLGMASAVHHARATTTHRAVVNAVPSYREPFGRLGQFTRSPKGRARCPVRLRTSRDRHRAGTVLVSVLRRVAEVEAYPRVSSDATASPRRPSRGAARHTDASTLKSAKGVMGIQKRQLHRVIFLRLRPVGKCRVVTPRCNKWQSTARCWR